MLLMCTGQQQKPQVILKAERSHLPASVHPSADVLRPPGTQLGAAVAPGDFYELQSSTWFIPRPGRGCSQVRSQLQKVLFAATPLSQCTRADAPLLLCWDGESCHLSRSGHKSQGHLRSSVLHQVRAAQSMKSKLGSFHCARYAQNQQRQTTPGTLPVLGWRRIGCARGHAGSLNRAFSWTLHLLFNCQKPISHYEMQGRPQICMERAAPGCLGMSPRQVEGCALPSLQAGAVLPVTPTL